MKAIMSTSSGSLDRLALSDVPTPVARSAELLVRIRATTVTRGDVVLRRMPRVVVRLVGETPKSILGHEFAGVVESVGDAVEGFDVEDRVFGTTTGLRLGAHAEYIAIPAGGVVARIPSGIAFEEAAPVPVGAMAAMHFLRSGGVGPGLRVLVNGASGSVGTFAVQIAKASGAHVTGVCSGSNAELVLSLGADAVIDYTRQDFTEAGETYDVIFDAVGKTSARTVRGILAEDGRFVTTQARRKERVEDLIAVRDLVAAGRMEAVIDRRYTLDQVAEAFRYVAAGHKRGNVVVSVGG